jgi:SAM-dependent methyltransferase
MEQPGWVPRGIDVDQPSIARVYDCYLGGFHNFTADRALVEQIRRVLPGAPLFARASRTFLTSAVRYCVQRGVNQFLDLGSGIPTVGNVHEVARKADPSARVVYVDSDPVAVAHSEAILDGDEHATIVEADIREPKRVIDDPATRRLLDFDRPVALLLVAVLHFIPDSDDPGGLVDQFTAQLAPGSYLIISHGTNDGPEDPRFTTVTNMYRHTVAAVTMRPKAEVRALFRDFELVPPGLTWVSQWRPPAETVESAEPETLFGAYGGVGYRSGDQQRVVT